MDKAKEKRAIELIKTFAPPDGEPYYLCYSGGKDSDCIRILAELSGVPYEIHHNLTTVDAPETVRYVKNIPNVIIDRPRLTMWQLIVKKKIPPTRLIRYCCAELKERGGTGRIKMTGVRAAESISRERNSGYVKIIGKPATTLKMAEEIGAKYKVTEKSGLALNFDDKETVDLVFRCYRTTSTLFNPILDWTTQDVWDFLRHYGCDGNPLYKCGEKRIGCIGCPMQGFAGMKKDFRRYPKYRANYVRAFDRMLEARKQSGLNTVYGWIDGEHVLRWWQGDDPMQMTLFDDAVDWQDEEYWNLPTAEPMEGGEA